ncbi:MoaF N-terminal domain-containing protein [Halodesulfovibrio spirochaetisodalis]|uniref:Molybdenum cofactor biosynthesis protein F N-terminal domain-containing protein n=1 Tax=Halodesulfovibrio spirochaetisodalis TaxID=1560234 RepID=A0A1B7X9T3_9BACT|nr:MoaF N-terminal domain-containing protein [Halodesulfovibrio spirochaetisodalis]OBQ46149.1 hypothetical protein SP90_14125 [Halodesulfovibrio spirochaetisodalis]
MIQRFFCALLLVLVLAGCELYTTHMTPDQLIGQTVILTLESGAFPDSTMTMQFVSSKDLVWRLSGNLGEATGSSDYLVSRINPQTILMAWRNEEHEVSYIVTMDFDERRCFLVRADHGRNLLSEGVVAIE